jgi:antitoxin component of MazEF toxin-antitoxin module
MPIRFERKVFTSGGSLRVNIPVEITKALEIVDGDTLLISLTDHQILMEKAKGKK